MISSEVFRAIRANARLGWNIEGNWAPPVLYLAFALIAPVSAMLMLVFMYLVILGDSSDKSFLAFLLTGSTVFMYMRLILQGACFAVVEDREHFRILRYIYIAPVPFPAQVFGRVAVKLLIGTVGVLITLTAGRFILHIPFSNDINWLGVFGGLVIGLTGAAAISWMLASLMLLIDRMGWMWAEGFAGLLFLVSGAVIPFKELPGIFAYIGKILPVTYWAEVWRHSFFGGNTIFSLPDLGIGEAVWMMSITSVIWLVIAIFFHRLCDMLARRWARIERETFY